jgi:Helix-turn-helix
VTQASGVRDTSPPAGCPPYSIYCYTLGVPSRGDVLREVMLESGISQSELSRISGVRQPSISQYLSGHVTMSDDMGGSPVIVDTGCYAAWVSVVDRCS